MGRLVVTGWRWTVLSDGGTSAREAVLVEGGSWRRHVRIPTTAVLLEHPTHGRILFDTGYSPRILDETRAFPYRLYRWAVPIRLTEPDGIAGVLRRRGVPPESVERVLISHWHADHIGGLRDFPHARVLTHPDAWASVKGRRGFAALLRACIPGLIPEDVESRLAWIREGEDPLGDGSLAVLDLPGHARGQVGVRFRAHDGQDVLLAADAAWLTDAVRYNRMPHRLTGFLNDLPVFRQTLARLHALHRREPDLLIVPCHCPETGARVDS